MFLGYNKSVEVRLAKEKKMKHLSEKLKLKDWEFVDYKWKSKASRRVKKRMRRAAKRVNKLDFYNYD